MSEEPLKSLDKRQAFKTYPNFEFHEGKLVCKDEQTGIGRKGKKSLGVKQC